MQFNYRIKYNYFLIGIGCIFLFNGNINVFDFLPDFIGYIFIVLGIGSLFLANEKFNNARQAAYYLLLITLAKFIASFFTGKFANEDLLLITALFNIVEFLLAYRLFRNLFAANELYFEINDSPTDARDVALYGLFMKIFLVVKYGVSLLAEMTVLINPDFLDRISFNSNMSLEVSSLYRACVMIAVIVVTLFGLFMLTLIPSHFRRLSKNEAVNDKLRIIVLSVENRDITVKLRKYGLCFLLLYISLFFLLDLNMDGINVLPDVISAFSILAVLVIMRSFFTAEQYKKSTAIISALIIITAVSLALNIYNVTSELHRAFSDGNDTALNIAVTVTTIASNTLFGAVYIYIFKSADKLRIGEMNLAKGYIPQKEFERKANPKAVNAFITSAFALKSFSLFNITYSFLPLLYLVLCIFFFAFSVYKLDKIRTCIRYYYQANKPSDWKFQ